VKVGGKAYRSIMLDGQHVSIVDQTRLPHAFEIVEIAGLDDACRAIGEMQVRGAPLIGATAACGLALAMRSDPSDTALAAAQRRLLATRPTAVNLRWALEDVGRRIAGVSPDRRAEVAFGRAAEICDEDVATNALIGDHGLRVLERIYGAATRGEAAGATLNVLTHCNAGWLATVDWGTALAPIYKAHDAGLPVHVWVDETRPRNQGASLTAWELGQHGVPHTLIVDNAGGHLMQRGQVDVCIVGSDRTTAAGDVCNKIGTYLKALAARDNDVPFYVALPGTTIDWRISNGTLEVPIEERDAEEVTHIAGVDADGIPRRVRLAPAGSPARNLAFDVTPARLVTGLITERGVCPASPEGLAGLYPEAKP
jgi:methylthioribose-1-phosphate isomerase